MWGWQVLFRRVEIESLFMANKGSSSDVRGTTAYPPTSDIRWPTYGLHAFL